MKKNRGVQFALLIGAFVASLLVGLLSSNLAVTLNVLVIGLGLAMVAARRELSEEEILAVAIRRNGGTTFELPDSGGGPATMPWSELSTPTDQGPGLQRAGGDQEPPLQPAGGAGADPGAGYGDAQGHKLAYIRPAPSILGDGRADPDPRPESWE